MVKKFQLPKDKIKKGPGPNPYDEERGTMKKQLFFRCDTTLHRAIFKISKEKNVPILSLIRDICEEFVTKYYGNEDWKNPVMKEKGE